MRTGSLVTGKQVHVDAAPGGDLGGDLTERGPGAQAFGPEEMGGQVTVTEPEPALAAQLGQFLHHRPRLAGHAPSGLAIVHAGQGVGDRVQVGADVETVEDGVVAGVDHGGD